jgi:hypothetical protein
MASDVIDDNRCRLCYVGGYFCQKSGRLHCLNCSYCPLPPLPIGFWGTFQIVYRRWGMFVWIIIIIRRVGSNSCASIFKLDPACILFLLKRHLLWYSIITCYYALLRIVFRKKKWKDVFTYFYVLLRISTYYWPTPKRSRQPRAGDSFLGRFIIGKNM